MDTERSIGPLTRAQSAAGDPERGLADLAERQHGVIARRQLLELGLGRRAIAHRLERARLHAVHPGVYAVGHRRVSRSGHWMAAVLASGPSAVLSHRSAAALWGIHDSRRSSIEVIALGKRRPAQEVEARRGRLRADETTTEDGIPVTTVSRTLLDLAAVLNRRRLERALREAEVRRLGDPTSLAILIDRHHGRRGTASLRAILAAGRLGENATRSELEERFLALVDRAALTRPEVNARVEVVGRALECDCLWRTERLVVELDGHAFHAPASAFEVDRARDRALQVAGWRVVRFTWRQLEKEAGKVVEDLRTLLAPRANLDRRMISTNQFKNGTHVDIEGTVFKIVAFQHVKPGKGPAFVRTKLKRLSDGASLDRTFRAGEKFRPVRTEARKMQFLYSDGSDAHFMDLETYEQTVMPQAEAASALRWLLPSEEVDVLYVDGSPADLQVPSAVELAVADTEPGVRGDTASGGGDKPATLESGVVVRVPLFVNAGDRVRVDTRSGEYVARA